MGDKFYVFCILIILANIQCRNCQQLKQNNILTTTSHQSHKILSQGIALQIGIFHLHMFSAHHMYKFLFSNNKKSQSNDNYLNLLIDCNNFQSFQSQGNNDGLQLNLKVIFKEKKDSQIEILSYNKLSSLNAYNFQIPSKEGFYQITISSNLDVSIKMIINKESLINLDAPSNLIITKQRTYQLSLLKKSAIVEIFVCWGEISVDYYSSQNILSKIDNKQNEIAILDHNHDNGHYIINLKSIQTQSFLKIKSKSKITNYFSYLITYYQFQSNYYPYESFNFQMKQISYQPTFKSIIFKLSTIQLKEQVNLPAIIEVQYILYISKNKNIISKYTNCRMEKIFSLKATPKQIIKQTVSFQFEFDYLQKIVPSDIYYVGAEGIISIKFGQNKTNQSYKLKFIYNILQISHINRDTVKNILISKDQIQNKVIQISLFLVILLLLLLSWRYLIRNSLNDQSNQMIKQNVDNHKTNNTNPTQQNLPGIPQINLHSAQNFKQSTI